MEMPLSVMDFNQPWLDESGEQGALCKTLKTGAEPS